MKRWVVIIGGVLLVAFFIKQVLDHEPRFEGRKLSAWLDDPELSEAQIGRAVRAIGTNVIPQLEAWLLEKPSTLEKSLRWLGHKSPYLSSSYRPSVDANLRAMRGFFLLGEQAAPAVPWLAARAAKQDDDFEFYLKALAACGPEGVDSINRLEPAMTQQEKKSLLVALAFGISSHPSNQAALESKLAAFLNDPDPAVRLRAYWTVRNFRDRCPRDLVKEFAQQIEREADPGLRDTGRLLIGELTNEVLHAHPSINLDKPASAVAPAN